jgi:hypothetical protein
MDAISGEVWFAPFAIEDARMEGGAYCNHTSDFEIDSELFMATGKVNGKIGTHYFVWHHENFSPLYFEAEKCP